MPVNIPDSLPAKALLEAENVFVMGESRAVAQDIRPLRILILNLMPLKIVTEAHLLRVLSNSPLQVEVELLMTSGHTHRNTPDRKSTRLNSSHVRISYAVFCLKKKKKTKTKNTQTR